ncbi:MAG: aldehyde dehydrogenase family protein [Myxococcales bacterium]|nr:aldehyde dehydrogenase family protein [Myxococcales bacterium]
MPEITSPVHGETVLSYKTLSPSAAAEKLARAEEAQRAWARVDLADRVRLCEAMLDRYDERLDDNALQITMMMGKPVAHARGEFRGGFSERTRHLCKIAAHALRPLEIDDGAQSNIRRFIRRDPVGVVMVIAAWNYPLLVPVGCVVSSVLAGDAVLLKHAHQTAGVADQIERAFLDAGAPEGLVQAMHLDHAGVNGLLDSKRLGYLSFTGSVGGGREVYKAVAARDFIGVGMELGGKDPAYVCADAEVQASAAGIADGAFFNAGQSCCAVERVYVHADVYDAFLEAMVAEVHALRVGDPRVVGTTMGPVVNEAAARHTRAQTEQALAAGARQVTDDARFDIPDLSPCYLPPRVLTGVTHAMDVMREETFGPVVGVMKVASDDEAVALMNDSLYGLTASVWTQDPARGLALAERLAAGTIYANRCDYLDPALAWTGVKDSGFGVSLSELGFHVVTRPKSYHLRNRL